MSIDDDQREYYTRLLKRYEETCTPDDHAERPERMRRWCCEALREGLRELAAGDWLVAFRCLLQAHRYAGAVGTHWPTPVAHDVAIALQCEIEHKLRAPTAELIATPHLIATDAQITALRRAAVGTDARLVRYCDLALAGDVAARIECTRLLVESAPKPDGDHHGV